MEQLEDFLRYCSIEKKLDDKTLIAYKTDILQCIGIIHNIPIDQMSKEIIRTYISEISHYSYKTIKRKLASLKAMLNYCETEYEWYVNPMRKMNIHMREPVRLPVVMTIGEVMMFMKEAYNQSDCYKSNTYSYIKSIRDIAIIELLFVSGMRVSELCDLKIKDVNITEGRVRIIGKGNKERVIDICQEATLKALTNWLTVRGEYDAETSFFCSRLHKQLSPQSVRVLIRQLSKKLEMVKHITPHTFRHTFATLLLEEDVDITYIQHFLGHSSITTTQIYTHVNMRKQREILRNKHPRRYLMEII